MFEAEIGLTAHLGREMGLEDSELARELDAILAC